ncbi:MAG: hypothetical protein O3B95_12110 [Chloroflexi bacterium]|nr:hypothetical protein [Chloroflexota bacterium]
MVEPGSLDAARVLNEYGVALGLGNLEFKEAQHVLEEALAIAQREEAAVLEVHILHNLSWVHRTAGDNRRALQRSLQLLDRAKLLDVPALEANGHRTAAVSLINQGETADALRHNREALRLSTRL